MACTPGYIEIDGNCVFDFGGDVLPDGTVKTDGNDGNFWQNAGDFLEKNADNIGSILGGLGGLFGGGKKKSDPALPVNSNPSPPPAKTGNSTGKILLIVGVVVVGLVAVAFFLKKKKVG